jgi:hypothetical protein
MTRTILNSHVFVIGMTPVLPGYYGMVSADFAKVGPGGHVITQGEWNGLTRPGWLDPRDPGFKTCLVVLPALARAPWRFRNL